MLDDDIDQAIQIAWLRRRGLLIEVERSKMIVATLINAGKRG